MILRPDYINAITPYIDAPFVKILTGIRRSGKSTILKMLAEELKGRGVPEKNIITYKLDNIEYEDITAKAFYDRVKTELAQTGKTYLFFDEIQEIPS